MASTLNHLYFCIVFYFKPLKIFIMLLSLINLFLEKYCSLFPSDQVEEVIEEHLKSFVKLRFDYKDFYSIPKDMLVVDDFERKIYEHIMDEDVREDYEVDEDWTTQERFTHLLETYDKETAFEYAHYIELKNWFTCEQCEEDTPRVYGTCLCCGEQRNVVKEIYNSYVCGNSSWVMEQILKYGESDFFADLDGHFASYSMSTNDLKDMMLWYFRSKPETPKKENQLFEYLERNYFDNPSKEEVKKLEQAVLTYIPELQDAIR